MENPELTEEEIEELRIQVYSNPGMLRALSYDGVDEPIYEAYLTDKQIKEYGVRHNLQSLSVNDIRSLLSSMERDKELMIELAEM